MRREIPEDRIFTYGIIAAGAGNPRAARQVARILHPCSKKGKFPWHGVVNRHGRISLRRVRVMKEKKSAGNRRG